MQSTEEKNDDPDRLGLEDVDNAEAEGKSPLITVFEGSLSIIIALVNRIPIFYDIFIT